MQRVGSSLSLEFNDVTLGTVRRTKTRSLTFTTGVLCYGKSSSAFQGSLALTLRHSCVT
jgi:hypothetical protein